MAPFKNTSFGGSQSIKVNEIEYTPTISDNKLGLSVTVSGQKVFTPGNGYTYHIFVGPGTFIVNHSGNADILVVGGGGGGGKGYPSSYRGGAGGAGGFREELNVLLTKQVYEITIGDGGYGTSVYSVYGADGQSGGTTSFSQQPVATGGAPFTVGGSSVTTLSVGGGGGGGGSNYGVPSPEGSGGGGEGGPSPGYFGNPGGGSGSYGFNGGRGSHTPNYASGGGGGAGGISPTASGNTGGTGGIGKAAFSGDTGVPTDFGTPGPTSGRFFAGGGGGAGSFPGPGQSGGGDGNGGHATSNTGSGGGGSNPSGTGGNGAPGIVIIRYQI